MHQARQHIIEGDTQGALDALAPLNDHAIQVLTAQYRAVRDRVIKQTISFEEAQLAYNKINDSLLKRIEDIERGTVTPDPRPVWRRWLVPALVGSILLAVAGWALVRSTAKDELCPKFDKKEHFKVVIFPFQKLSGAGAQQPTVAIMNEISHLTQKRALPVQIGAYQVGETQLISIDEKEDLAAECGADLVIHGDFMSFANDSVAIQMRYRFFNLDQISGSTKEGLPNMGQMGNMRSLNDVVFSICAQIAIRLGKKDVAKTWLSKLQQTDEATEAPLRKALE
jgi:hypothetical protein